MSPTQAAASVEVEREVASSPSVADSTTQSDSLTQQQTAGFLQVLLRNRPPDIPPLVELESPTYPCRLIGRLSRALPKISQGGNGSPLRRRVSVANICKNRGSTVGRLGQKREGAQHVSTSRQELPLANNPNVRESWTKRIMTELVHALGASAREGGGKQVKPSVAAAVCGTRSPTSLSRVGEKGSTAEVQDVRHIIPSLRPLASQRRARKQLGCEGAIGGRDALANLSVTAADLGGAGSCLPVVVDPGQPDLLRQLRQYTVRVQNQLCFWAFPTRLAFNRQLL